MTGSTHEKHRSARSPRPTQEGPASDNPITGPRTRMTQSEPGTRASAGASGRHNEPGCRPASAYPAQPASRGERENAPRRQEGRLEHRERPDRTRRGAPTRGHKARQRGTPQATILTQGQVPSNNGHRVPRTRAARTTRNEPQHRNRCQATANPHTTNPSQEWRGTAEIRTQTHTPTTHTPARSGGVQEERAHQHTHIPTLKPRVAGRSRNPSPNTHTHAHTPARSGGVQEEHAHQHAHHNTPARTCRAHPKPEPKHTHPHRTPEPGVARDRRSAHTSTRKPQHPSQVWQGAAETRAQPHTLTPHIPARSGGFRRSAHTNSTPQHPSQEWRDAAKTRTKTRTPTPHAPARSGGVQREQAHQHAHPTPKPGLARRGRNPSPSTHTHAAHPSQEWRGTERAGTRTRTPQHPSQEWRGAAETEPKHSHPHRTPQPGVAGYKGSAHTSTHTPQHPSQEWRGAVETQTQAHTPMPRAPARSGGVQGENAHKRAHHNTPARRGGAQPKPEPKHTQLRCTAQLKVA